MQLVLVQAPSVRLSGRMAANVRQRCALVCSASHGGPGQVRASRVPGPDEDREVAHSAYMHAFQESAPAVARIPGMQEFAGAVSGWVGRPSAAALPRSWQRCRLAAGPNLKPTHPPPTARSCSRASASPRSSTAIP